jgi:hypothetical protein
MAQTKAERLRALEAAHGAKSSRKEAGGVVTLALELENGDRITGRGPTTDAALTNLEQRVAQWAAAEG